jgi:ParB family chromosome partitioning protein
VRIDIRQIQSNPGQPRQDFDPAEMQALAESISMHGLLQPVVVRRVEGRYQLIAGERRLRAAAQAGWSDVPANVVEADDRQVAEMAIVENLHRKDLNPLEKAASFQRYLQQYSGTQEDLAGRLNLDRSTIANLIRLLELPEPVQEAIRQAKITQGHARALLPLGEEREQIEFCGRIQREGLSVRQTEALVQETIDAADAEPLGIVDREGKRSRPARARSEHLAALEQELHAALGMKVKITHNARGRGKLVVHFRNHEEFERLRQQICAPPTHLHAQTQVG